MFFEGANGTFGSIAAMVVRWDQLNLHLVLFDAFLSGLGAFIIHDVEHRLVLPCLQNVEDFREGGNEGCVGEVWHWADDDGVKAINVCTKNYCIFLNDQTRNAPVISVYMVPIVALARAGKQNMSCTAHALWMGNKLSTFVCARTMSGWLL